MNTKIVFRRDDEEEKCGCDQETCPCGGFTLIEILVVIGLIALLAAIVIIAINPARQFAQGRDTQRISNVETILNAIGQRIADNKGTLKGDNCGDIPTATSTAITWDANQNDGNLGCLVPTYISSVLKDPDGSDYHVVKDATTKRITVSAPKAEITKPISITR